MASGSNKGLSFTIKLNLKSEAAEDDCKEDQEQFLSRTCNICGKKFRSGKALGGHRRMHFEARKKKPGPKHLFNQWNAGTIDRRLLPTGSSNNSVVSARASTGSNNTGSQSASCYSCGKVFPSMKSLFGHMRSHPKRGWRGILPPASLTNSKLSSTSSSTLNHVPPVLPLLNKAIDLNHQVESSFVASKMLGSRPGLMQALDLSRSLPSWPVTAQRGRKSNMIGSSTSVTSSEDEEEDVVDDIDACHLILELAQGKPPNSSMPQSTNKRRKIDHVLDEAARFRCNICNKTFSTYQALGGHMSSHTKASNPCKNFPKIISTVPDCNPNINGDPFTSTTQKLNTTGEVSQASARKTILDLDLNKPPPVKEDELQEDATIHHMHHHHHTRKYPF